MIFEIIISISITTSTPVVLNIFESTTIQFSAFQYEWEQYDNNRMFKKQLNERVISKQHNINGSVKRILKMGQ